jgi:hypothetical protein
MYQSETNLPILARIPQVGGGQSWARSTQPTSKGRLISQVSSFRLLAACIVVLLVIAAFPMALRKKSAPAASTPAVAAAPAPQWQPSGPAASIGVAPVATAPAAAPTFVPVSATANSAPIAGAFPQPAAGKPLTTADNRNLPLMSAWPNPAAPPAAPGELGAEQPQVEANRAKALRPPDYTRNRYDRTGPSVH